MEPRVHTTSSMSAQTESIDPDVTIDIVTAGEEVSPAVTMSMVTSGSIDSVWADMLLVVDRKSIV